ncbi:MAG: DUF427 domain-containing protein, partial [Chloroflexi bacterium]
MTNKVIIRDRQTDEILAEGVLDQDVIVLEGTYYFDPRCVRLDKLTRTARTYTCPYKGVSFWIDLDTEDGRIENVAWVYEDVKQGYEHIRGHIGFYMRTMRGIKVETVS